MNDPTHTSFWSSSKSTARLEGNRLLIDFDLGGESETRRQLMLTMCFDMLQEGVGRLRRLSNPAVLAELESRQAIANRNKAAIDAANANEQTAREPGDGTGPVNDT